MKRRMIGLLLLVCCSAGVSIGGRAQASVFEDIEASVPWHSARTRISVDSGSDGAQVAIRRSIMPWIEIAAVSRPPNQFAHEAKLMLARELRPLSIAVDLAHDRISLLSSLFFGPVGADIGRTWGASPARWAIVWLAPHPQLTLAVGLEDVDDRMAPVIGIRWRPGWAPRWGITLRVDGGGPEISIGVGR